jgi:hypothetical protein
MRFFSDQLGNGIYLASTGTFKNGLTAVYQGFESTLKHSFSENGDLTVNFAHELANSNGPVLAAAGQTSLATRDPFSKDILTASTPRNSASFLYIQKLSHDYTFSTAFYYQSAMQPFDRGVIDFQPTQRRVDARFAKSFNQGIGLKAEVALVLQNLFDTRYTEYVANNVFNRRGMITLALNW